MSNENLKENEKQLLVGGDLVVKSLQAEGIRYIFGLVGGELLTIYDAVYRWGREENINTIMFRHEQAAAHAADAWSRVSDAPGVCMGTVGPGATHMVPAVAAANSDNIPMIVIAPSKMEDLDDKFSFQSGLDQISLFRPITKYQKKVRKAKDIPDAIRKAFRQALGGRPGPVFLEITKDALYEKTDRPIEILSPECYRCTGKSGADPALIQTAVDLLLDSQNPVLIAGGGVINAEAWAELQELSDYLKIPALTTIMGIGSISSDKDTFLGITLNAPAAQSAIQEADLALACGSKLSYTVAYGMPPLWKKHTKIIQIDIDPTILGRARKVDLPILGDCKLVLEQILEEVKKRTGKRETSEWVKSLINVRKKNIETINKRALKPKTPMRPETFLKNVLENLDKDAIIVLDGGDISLYSTLQLDFYKPRPPKSTLMSAGMGHLGTCIPYAIGCKLAQPEKQVAIICGDGSFLFNVQELETAVRINTPFLCFIANNSAWGMIKTNQKFNFGKRFIDTDLDMKTNYAEIAKGFGCFAERITDPNEIKPAIQRGIESNLPCVFDIVIAYMVPEIRKVLLQLGINLA
ncbi:MAG: thiamine pyrophosphate-binding protein [Candidatus Helarchaeota archaeon]|nr:thiamine pyrophosphate-binding protein [Candidatus Helarchaeota archaeon]